MVNSHGTPIKSSKMADPLKLKKNGDKKTRGESGSENAGQRSASPGMKEKESGRLEFESKVPKGQRTDRRRHGSDRETAAKVDGENVAGVTSDREHPAEGSPDHHVEHSMKHVKRLRTSRGCRSEGSKRLRSKTEQEGDAQVSEEKAASKEEGSPKDENMEDKELEKKEAVEPGVEPSSDKGQDNATTEDDAERATDAKVEMTPADNAMEARDTEVKADVEVAHDVTNDQRARPDDETEIIPEKVKVTEPPSDKVDTREEGMKYVAPLVNVEEAERKVDNAEPDTSLSLGLSGSRRINRTRSYQTISQAETFSHGITTSLSLSYSHQFTHNPSCSLTQTSHDNQEFSSASQPVYQEPSQSVGKRLEYGDYVRQRDMNRGENSHYSNHSRPKGSMHRKQVKSGSLTRSAGYSERPERPTSLFAIVREIVSEPVPLVARKMQDLPADVLEELKTSVKDLLERSDKREEFLHLQRILQSRSDMSVDVLQMAHRVQLEVLVALKTGIPGFLLPENQMKILIEVFMHLRCRNVQCLNQLPADDCECKICTQKSGFCSACMCVVCSKFDFENNTCSWVGCDYCIHWCHTDCGLRKSYIKSGPTINGAAGTSEMQFHCVACGHTSELFGFVKDVFVSCARAWSREVLCKELECAKRMFQGSEDVRGKQLCRKADQLLRKLDSDSDVADACNSMLRFFEDSGNLPLEEENGGLGDRSTVAERAALALHNYDRLMEEKRTDAAEMQYERAKKKAEIEELESIVRIKQAEAKMFQTRADEAAREAEGLQRIVMAKRLKDDEEYAAKISKLQLVETEEKRKRKFEYLKVLERGSYNFDIVRTLMGDLQGLLTNMEAAKRLKADDVSGVEKYLQRYLQSRAI